MELLAIFVALCMSVLAWLQLGSRRRKLPPGPYQVPIVGNLFQVLGENPQHAFAQLSKKHGPLMSLRFGSHLNVVVSSPELAKEVLTKPGFSGRAIVQAAQVHDIQRFMMAFAPVTSDEWRIMRKISKEQIFSNPSLEASQKLRQENLLRLLDYLQRCCDGGRVVDIRHTAYTTTINLMAVALYSIQPIPYESDVVSEFSEIMDVISNIFGEPNLADFFPILQRFDLQSIKQRAHASIARMLDVMNRHIEERLRYRRQNPNGPAMNDFLDTLIDINQESDKEMSLKHIANFLIELFVGGAGSTATTTEWTMTELLRHPEKLSKAKAEVRKVMGEKKVIDDSDISRLPYMQAVINEILRLHPPAPLLFPRSADEDKELCGYFIPKDTRMIFNAWAMGRDPDIWPDAESFEPERFLGKNIDYRGNHFELIPFGSGRRICPGMPLAHRILHATVAALIRNFDWEFAAGEKDRNGELFGALSLRREAPLKAIALNP